MSASPIKRIQICPQCADALKKIRDDRGEDHMRAAVLATLQACDSCHEQLPKPAPGGRLVTSATIPDLAWQRAAELFEQLSEDARELATQEALATPDIVARLQKIDAVLVPMDPSPLHVGFALGNKARNVLHLHALVLMVVAGYLCNVETGVRGPFIVELRSKGDA